MEKMEKTQKMVPDASVMLKWFLQREELADKAAIIRNRFQSGELDLLIPRYALYEFSNVITLDKTGYSFTEARTALDALLRLKIKAVPYEIKKMEDLFRQWYDNPTSTSERGGYTLITKEPYLDKIQNWQGSMVYIELHSDAYTYVNTVRDPFKEVRRSKVRMGLMSERQKLFDSIRKKYSPK